MIVTDHADIQALMNGQGIEQVVGSRPPAIGATVTVQPAVGERSVCRAQVLDVWELKDDGGYVVMLGGKIIRLRKLPAKRSVRRVIIREEPVRLMKPGVFAGDTADVRHAMRNPSADLQEPEETGVPYPALTDSEPEMVPKSWKDPGVPLRAEQQATLDRAARDRLSLGGQLDALLERASASSVDVHARRRRIQRELELLERDLGAAA